MKIRKTLEGELKEVPKQETIIYRQTLATKFVYFT